MNDKIIEFLTKYYLCQIPEDVGERIKVKYEDNTIRYRDYSKDEVTIRGDKHGRIEIEW